MTMHNRPHPGEFIRSIYLEPFKLDEVQQITFAAA